jgi:molybdopterin converting factor small subunit
LNRYNHYNTTQHNAPHRTTSHQSINHFISRLLLAERYPNLKDIVLDEDNLTLALNEEYVSETQSLKEGDVVALIPPISGG